MITFITGGARSGKSDYAQRLALSLSAQPVYIATARKWDENFEERILKHQQDRGSQWISLEIEKNVSRYCLEDRVYLIDCVTLWLSNFFSDYRYDIEKSLADFKTEIDNLFAKQGSFIIVSNEIGMGVHGESPISRKFTDLQGWANQYVAAKAQEVVLMVAGIPVHIKMR